MRKWLSACLCLLPLPALAGPLNVTEGWFRLLPGGLPAAGYFTVTNTTRSDIAIVDAVSPACAMLMMHRSTSSGGMGGMEMVDRVNVPAGGVIKFAPGGYHLMCDNPRMALGSKMPVRLTLSNGSSVTVAFIVRNAAGR